MAPAETWPSAIEAAGEITAPVCMVAGSADEFTPVAYTVVNAQCNRDGASRDFAILGLHRVSR